MGTIGRTNTGGGSLNLTIFASVEQPAIPVENMVWFNTDTAIPHWYFQNTAPSNPEVGDVYVTITTTAANVLQILRNNGIQLYFGTPRQWDGTNWNIIGGKIYYNNVWHNLQTFVYDGSIGNAENNFNHNVGGYPWQKAGGSAASLARDTDSFTCKFSNGGEGVFYTKNKIDFSAVKSVKIVYTGSGGGFVNTMNIGIFTSAGSGGAMSGTVASVNWGTPGAKTTLTINTESLNSSYYLGVHFYSTSGSTVNYNCKIYSIELIS